MSEATVEPPSHVRGLAERRAEARARRDYAQADVLRERIEEEGWLVRDTPEGFELAPKPPFRVWPTVASLPVPEDHATGAGDDAQAAAGTEEIAGGSKRRWR